MARAVATAYTPTDVIARANAVAGATASTLAYSQGHALHVAVEAACSATEPPHATTRATSPVDATCSSSNEGSAERRPSRRLGAIRPTERARSGDDAYDSAACGRLAGGCGEGVWSGREKARECVAKVGRPSVGGRSAAGRRPGGGHLDEARARGACTPEHDPAQKAEEEGDEPRRAEWR